MKSSRELWATDPYPASRHCWYVPAGGIGRFGCIAEAIVLTNEQGDDDRSAEQSQYVNIRFGDRMHQLFGELTPKRPAPRRVL